MRNKTNRMRNKKMKQLEQAHHNAIIWMPLLLIVSSLPERIAQCFNTYPSLAQQPPRVSQPQPAFQLPRVSQPPRVSQVQLA